VNLSKWTEVELLTLEQAAHLACGIDPNHTGEVDGAQKEEISFLLQLLVDGFKLAFRHARECLTGLLDPPEVRPDIFKNEHILGELPSLELRCDFQDALDNPHEMTLWLEDSGRYPGKFLRNDLASWFDEKGYKSCFPFQHEITWVMVPKTRFSSINQSINTASVAELDENSSTYPPELDAALKAWQAVATAEGKDKPKARLRAWLDANTTLSNEAKERIAIVANWNKLGGASRTS
jgi:hypothetical protein